ncbi:helix-turn-helix domain-containing protein [Bradyrhizobium genosp. P]|uniref:helix-turn-helix domain-containing protein n=1 Tax=Bradyrhizobium genosp. P TaxID=83641 RepID=UPI003CE77E80
MAANGAKTISTRGERLIAAMEMRGMRKQHALAHALGVNESTVTRWIKNGPMSLESAIALCQALDMSLDWFLAGHGSIDRNGTASALPPADARLWSSFRKFEASMSTQSRSLLIDFMDSMVPR